MTGRKPGWSRSPAIRAISNMVLSDEDRPGELGEWSRRRQRGEVIQATLHELTGYARQVFLEHGTLSFVSVPIMLGTTWWGFLGFDDCKQERVWSPLEIDVSEDRGRADRRRHPARPGQRAAAPERRALCHGGARRQ